MQTKLISCHPTYNISLLGISVSYNKEIVSSQEHFQYDLSVIRDTKDKQP